MMRTIQRILVVLVAPALSLSVLGCNVLQWGDESTDGQRSSSKTRVAHYSGDDFLPKIAPSRDTIVVEVIGVERPINDPLMGNALWDHVAEVSAIPAERRRSLRVNGFRIAHASSNPPRALQQILGLTTEITDDSQGDSAKRLAGRRIHLLLDQSAEIQTTPYRDRLTLALPIDGGHEKQEFENARCVLRMTAKRVQDGWATLTFQPEIHHGANAYRPTAAAIGWRAQTRQAIIPLFDQTSEVTLNLHEMAIITTSPSSTLTLPDGEKVKSIGQHFFLGTDEEGAIQRMHIVRLSGMPSTKAVYSTVD